MGLPESLDESRRDRLGEGSAPAGDHDGVRLLQQLQTATGHDPEAADGAQGTGLDGANGEAIPVRAHLRPGQAEDLDRDSELECAEAVIGKGDDEAVWHDVYACWQKRRFRQ